MDAKRIIIVDSVGSAKLFHGTEAVVVVGTREEEDERDDLNNEKRTEVR